MTDLQRAKYLAKFEAYNDVLNIINSFDTKLIDKRMLYEIIMDMRPKVEDRNFK